MDDNISKLSRRRFIKASGRKALFFGMGVAMIGSAAASSGIPDGYTAEVGAPNTFCQWQKEITNCSDEGTDRRCHVDCYDNNGTAVRVGVALE